MLDKYNRILGDAPHGKTFQTKSGEIRSLSELRNILLEKGKPFFDEYVNENANHFANWVEHVFHDHELANEMKRTRSYGATVKLVDDRLRYVELWMRFNKDKEMAYYDYPQEYSFTPSFHKFETLFDLPQHEPIVEDIEIKEVEPEPDSPSFSVEVASVQEEVLSNAPPEAVLNAPQFEGPQELEEQLIQNLESQFPGLKVTSPPKPKGIFSRIFGKR
jgi:hypothetical protein